MGNSSKLVLGIILGGMMAIDMGGPFNKAAYVCGVASIASGNYDIMAAVMIGGMTPPCAIALATLLFNGTTRWNFRGTSDGKLADVSSCADNRNSCFNSTLRCFQESKRIKKDKEKGDSNMKEFKYVVTDAQGIHARPAGELVKACKEFSCDIKIAKDGKAMNAKAIFGVMGLAVKQGNEVVITFDGADEEAAYETISKFMQENL